MSASPSLFPANRHMYEMGRVPVVCMRSTLPPQLCSACSRPGTTPIAKLRCHGEDALKYMCYQPTMWKDQLNKGATFPYTTGSWPKRTKTYNLDGTRSDGARPKLGSAMHSTMMGPQPSDHWKLFSVGSMLRMAPRKALPDMLAQRAPPLYAGPVHSWQLPGPAGEDRRQVEGQGPAVA